jgi:hypothetical protein
MKGLLFVVSVMLLTVAMHAQNYVVPPDVAATAPSPDFPVHIHVFGVHWNRVNGGYDGYGRADLLGPAPQGIDYTFSCSEPFLHNVGKDEFYQARWKKQDMKLEILMQKVGSDKLHKCELKTSVKPGPYGKYPAGAAVPPAAPPK